jgi:hypothetical protein
VFEYGFGQTIATGGLSAKVRTTALRAGLDFGDAFGTSALALGLGAGLDFSRIAPEVTEDSSLTLTGDARAAVPVVRLDARYELTIGAFRASAGLFTDASLADTHYDVRRSGREERIAAPWRVRPGLGLTLGWHTR